MIRRKLRYKILLGALALVLTVSVAITAVVSVLVTRQNKDAVHHSLDKTLTVIRDAVSETEHSFSEAIRHMATANKLGPDVKFLSEYRDGDLSMTGNSFANIGKAITNEGILDDLLTVRVYSQDKTLVCFFEKVAENSFAMGFLHQGKYHFRKFQGGDAYDQIEMTVGSAVAGTEMPPAWNVEIPSGDIGLFTEAGGHISLETRVPVYANVYKPETEQPEPKQFGFVVAVKQLDQSFVTKMGRIIDMGLNLFV
ncbi:MAG: hypothetical protein MI802_03285, partial [Desulfobacterales bacterium]|nr:hypothetical protein [Desulfobacterales bacterium]